MKALINIIVSLILVFTGYSCIYSLIKTVNIPELGLSFNLVPYESSDGNYRVKLYIGDDNRFQDDFIEFNFSTLYNLELYYTPDSIFYVVDVNNERKLKSNSDKFEINVINKNTDYLEYSKTHSISDPVHYLDSINSAMESVYLDQPHYSIFIKNTSLDVVIFNIDGTLLYSSDGRKNYILYEPKK